MEKILKYTDCKLQTWNILFFKMYKLRHSCFKIYHAPCIYFFKLCSVLSAFQSLCAWKILHPPPFVTWGTDHITAGSCDMCGHLWWPCRRSTPHHYLQNYFCWIPCAGMYVVLGAFYKWKQVMLLVSKAKIIKMPSPTLGLHADLHLHVHVL